jgi:cyclophilin family peptidyl-prolyl cis-trans isomerase
MIKMIAAITVFCSIAMASNPEVKLETTMGDIIIRLDSTAAPKTVTNFLEYVNNKFYDGTIFHRVIGKFMIQGGGFTTDMRQKDTKNPITNEAHNKVKNLRRTVAMARKSNPNSATSQFYINVVDNPALDYKDASNSGYGYCVFGKVIQGMDVVDAIAKSPTTSSGMMTDVPVTPVIIKSAVVLPLPSGQMPDKSEDD